MKRNGTAAKLSRETTRCVRLTLAMHDSGSQIERQNWQQQLTRLIVVLFQKKQNDVLEQALDYLWVADPKACDALAELIESHAESLTEDAHSNAVLLAIPVLVWSRYSIPAGKISRQRLQELREQLQAHLLASDTRLALADMLYSPDQLPRGFIETRALLQQLAEQATVQQDLIMDATGMTEAGEYVADIRYIFAAVVVNKSAPVFRWQQSDMTQHEVLQMWRLHTQSLFAAMLPGCHIKPLLPNAFFSAWRKIEQEARAFSLHAAVSYLCETLHVLPAELRAAIAPCYDQTLEEYRIGFSLLKGSDVLHGVVWALVGEEDEDSDIAHQIEAELTELGKVVVLTNSLPTEYCDDCGSPLFPNAEGDLLHPEMPETDNQITHLH